jgi:hypothetical protein
VLPLNDTREVEIELPGRYRIGPGTRTAVQSIAGVLEVHDV